MSEVQITLMILGALSLIMALIVVPRLRPVREEDDASHPFISRAPNGSSRSRI